eukprot:PLAT14358.1.p1 GENE.PLAT14358.1~~PLAT14358.1.p1  ORF type:complete len:482 (+),score=167.72 PLAT14358.1:39-1448(+)
MAAEGDGVGAAIVCTLRLAEPFGRDVLRSFVQWHVHLGFRKFILFLDDAEEAAADVLTEFDASLFILRRYDDALRAEWERCCSQWPRLARCFEEDVQSRQLLNAELAVQLALAAGLRWLLHIDIDELFFLEEGAADVDAHFAAMEEKSAGQVTYANDEGVPERSDIGDYFREVTLFRRHHATLPLTASARAAMHWWQSRTKHGQYLLFYDCGKSAVRLLPGVLPASVHSWRLPADCALRSLSCMPDARKLDLSTVLPRAPATVLHFPCCGWRWLSSKYAQLGDFEDAWFGGQLPIAPSFHLDARDAFKRGDDAARALFLQQLLAGGSRDGAAVDAQLAAGVCRRLTAVADALPKLPPRPLQLLVGEKEALAEPPRTVDAPGASHARAGGADGAAAAPAEFTYDKAWLIASIARDYLGDELFSLSSSPAVDGEEVAAVDAAGEAGAVSSDEEESEEDSEGDEEDDVDALD